MKKAKKEPRGRKPKFGTDRTRGSLTIRLRDRIRDDLETAARASGRSLSEEVEYRLEVALSRRDQLVQEWGPDVFAIARAASRTLWHIEHWSGKRWIEDDETFGLFTAATAELIRNYRDLVLLQRRGTPEGKFEGKTPSELAQMFASLGFAPPRPLEQAKFDPEIEHARKVANLKSWTEAMSKLGARPIDTSDGDAT